MLRRLSLALALTAVLWAGVFSAQARAQDGSAAGTPQAPPATAPASQTPAPEAPAPQTPAPEPPAQPAAAPLKLPPDGSPPLVRSIQLTFPKQGDVSVIEPQTYLYYIQTQVSRPSADVWVPYTEKTEKSLQEDFKRLWST